MSLERGNMEEAIYQGTIESIIISSHPKTNLIHFPGPFTLCSSKAICRPVDNHMSLSEASTETKMKSFLYWNLNHLRNLPSAFKGLLLSFLPKFVSLQAFLWWALLSFLRSKPKLFVNKDMLLALILALMAKLCWKKRHRQCFHIFSWEKCKKSRRPFIKRLFFFILAAGIITLHLFALALFFDAKLLTMLLPGV